MKIYTKTGDSGDTSLYGGRRIPKGSRRIDAYGTIDEVNAQIGIIRACKPNAMHDGILKDIQNQLFILGADLSTPLDVTPPKSGRIRQDHINFLEECIDRVEKDLKPLTSFILPSGSNVGAQLHVARTVCRRAERLVDLLGREEGIGKFPLIYLNRLSDLLFVLARHANQLSGIQEVPWSGDH